MLKKLLILMTLAALLAACLPSQQPTADVQAEVNTAVAGTMQAQEQIEQAVAQTVAAQDQSEVEGTEAPLDTNNVVLQVTETATPTFVIAPATSTNTAIPLKYTCSVFKKKPKDNETFNRGEEFDVKFIVSNTGTRIWPKGIDFKYVSGTKLATKRFEIPVALQPGQSYEINLDGKAPDTKGFYVMTYFVDGPMCYGYIAINVK